MLPRFGTTANKTADWSNRADSKDNIKNNIQLHKRHAVFESTILCKELQFD